jgi:anti-sigma B factor antagonist
VHLTVTTEAGLVAVAVSGRFDAHGIDDFDRQVVDLIDDSHPHVAVDLSDVEFMDSSALAALVRILKATIACSGTMTLVDVSDAVRIILELTRLDAVFAVAGSMAQARSRSVTAA